MTLRQMFNKIQGYNDIAEVVRTDKVYIGFNVDFTDGRYYDFKSFKKWLNEMFIDELVEEILAFDKYEFDNDYPIEFGYRYPIGDRTHDTANVGIYLYTA